MLHKTKGIVLNQIKYSESSIIANIYTEAFGRQSYIISGVRGKKGVNKINYFQPLSLLDLDVYHKPKNQVQRIKESKPSIHLSDIPYNLYKSTIALFIVEILYKSLKEEEKNSSLFNYIYNSILILDKMQNSINNFHLIFLVNLCKHLGFSPNTNFSDQRNIFDITEGEFISNTPIHSFYIDKNLSIFFNKILNSDFTSNDIKITNSTRQQLLDKIIEYYKYHLISLKEIKSLPILKEVFF